MKILLISALDVWSMGKDKGAGSFYKTIEGFAQNNSIDFICHGQQHGLPRTVRCHIINLPILDKLIRTPLVNYFTYPLWWLVFVIKSIRVADRLALEHRPDIIYAYEVQAVWPARYLSRRYNIPLVTRFQGTKLEINKIDSLWYRIKYFDHVLALKTPADLVIMTNDGTQGDKVLKQLGNKSKTLFWLNGIEKPNRLSSTSIKSVRRSLGLDDNSKLILMVSRLVGWKRVDRMISVLPKIDADFRLVIAGDGPEKSDLEEMVGKSNYSDNVKFLGAVKQEEIDKLMSAADIFVSLYDLSNVGNPLLQAMSYGKAIVTLDNGDTGEFINNSRGFLLPSNKPDKLANSINKLIGDAGLRRRLGAGAKQFADKNFWSWNERIKAETKEVEKLTRN